MPRAWKTALIIAAVLLLAGAATGYSALRASLPRAAGAAVLPGLAAPVEIERDARAIPRMFAESLADALRAQGFLHAQERFFQMDLLRRSAAGELAELLGDAVLELDRAQRVFRLRARAQRLLPELDPRARERLAAYTEGVNAGLADLGSRPPEYWLLRTRPEPWQAEDTLLVVFAVYTMLSNNHSYERPQAVMQATLPADVYEFLTPSTSRFDRPLLRAPDEPPWSGYAPAAVPLATVIDLREAPAPDPARRVVRPPLVGAASNQWAAAAARTARGVALLANDPHLPLRLPNIFFRSELHWPGGVARGAGIPGAPGILIGASDALAWGATVSNADQSDWVVVEVDGQDPTRYRVPDGTQEFTITVEEIRVRGRARPDTLEVRETRWGPVVERDWRGRPLALRAAWLEPDGINLEIIELMLARDVQEGVRVLARWAGPSLNWMLADRGGRIAWTVNGPLPRRVGFDGSVPQSWADGAPAWQGQVEPPAAIGASVLFTANNRTLPVARSSALSRMWMRPFRAKRIEELLAPGGDFTEHDFLAMQLDTRAEAYDFVREIVLEIAARNVREAGIVTAARYVASWNGHADADQTAFRLLHAYYLALLERVLAPLLAPAIDADPQFAYRWPLADEPLRRLLEERPTHLVPAPYRDWEDFLSRVLLDVLAELEADPGRPSIDAPWGEANRLSVAHPLAAIPLLARRLSLPPTPLPGSMVSLRVAAPGYGAALRMAVSPAEPEAGIFQMPGGQSGHFLSPYFKNHQTDWAEGAPAAFLAGPTVSSYTLVP